MGSTVQCVQRNVVRQTDVQRATDEALAPVKDILNMTIALADEAFLRMMMEDWNTSVEPKVRGAWNILEIIKSRGLKPDFLVLISSLSDVVGQTAKLTTPVHILSSTRSRSTIQAEDCHAHPSRSVSWRVLAS